MNKHTPGPWKWEGGASRCAEQVDSMGEYEGKKYLDVQLCGADGTDVIPLRIDHYSLEYDGDWITDEDRALIEAAPELLEACKEIAGMKTPGDAESPKHYQAYLYHKMRRIASAAIKKVEA